jgi:hypothetical protein
MSSSTTSRMTDESRQLRYHLGTLCERYNLLVADKDALDVRLGLPVPYDEATASVDPQAVYESESHAITQAIRALIGEFGEVVQRIRAIEGF